MRTRTRETLCAQKRAPNHSTYSFALEFCAPVVCLCLCLCLCLCVCVFVCDCMCVYEKEKERERERERGHERKRERLPGNPCRFVWLLWPALFSTGGARCLLRRTLQTLIHSKHS